ncbi:aquaporin nip1-2, partial [Trifolium pratense]
MASITNEAVLDVSKDSSQPCQDSDSYVSVPFLQKLIAELVGTYFLIFVGCASIIVNKNNDNVVTLPGIAIVWGLALVVLIYSLGHISGAHFNPAVTIAFATT